MAAAPQRSESYKAQREVEDLHLVLRARSGNRGKRGRDHPALREFRAIARLELLHRRRRPGRPRPGRARRPVQGDQGLPRRQGHDVPLIRRALHHPSDHHCDQDRDPPQAPAAQRGAVVQPHAGGVRRRLRLHARGCTARLAHRRSSASRDGNGGACSSGGLSRHESSPLEGRVLTLYLEGRSYEEIGELVDCDPKAVDNALQRVKRKVGQHLESRAVLDA